MNEKILRRKVELDNFYKVYLKTLNGHMNLTNRELDVLTGLCKLQSKYTKEGYTDDKLSKMIFSPISREEIRNTIGISSFNLNNIIKSLRDKQYIVKVLNTQVINPRIYVPDTEGLYSINFKIEIQ